MTIMTIQKKIEMEFATPHAEEGLWAALKSSNVKSFREKLLISLKT